MIEACDCPKLLSIYFDLCADATGVVCHQLGLLGSSSSPAKPSMSPAKGRLVIVLLPMLTVPDLPRVCYEPLQKYVEEGGWE